MHRRLSFLILSIPFLQTGCSDEPAPVPPADPASEPSGTAVITTIDVESDPSLVGYPLEAIQDAYLLAYESGNFQSVLSDYYVLPALRQDAEPTTYTDGEPNQTIANPEAVEFSLNPISTEQLSDAETYFSFTVPPTHLLDVTIPVDESMTVIKPVYLVEEEKGYLITPPSLKEQSQLEAALDEHYKKFYEEDGLWMHHWEFKFSEKEPSQFEVILHNFQDASQSITLIEPDELTLPPDDRRFYLHLIPGGQDSPVEETAGGRSVLSYAYQVGSSSMSTSVEVPFDSSIEYFPDEEPVEYRGRIALAYFGNDYGLFLQMPE